MRRSLRALAALVMVALIGPGCSNGSVDKSNPGAGSSTGIA